MKPFHSLTRHALLAVTATLLSSAAGRADSPLAAAPTVTNSSLSTTEQAIDQRLEGKFFFLRGFYLNDKLEFDINGKAVGTPQKGSFTLSGLEVKKVRSTKHSIVIEADRIGLHFFGSLPYEDDSKPFERIKVSKKPVEITIDRLVIEPEKKKKKKEKDAPQVAKAVPVGAKTSTLPFATAPVADETTGVANPPEVTFDDVDASTKTDLTAKALPAVAGAAPVDPHHDPRESWMQLSKALDQVFASGLDESVIATLPDYWQNYFATKAGKNQASLLDASVMRPGAGISSPKLLTSLDPASNDYAQKNGIAGMTLLSTIVGASGDPKNVTIVRPIGFGLDEQAVAAVEHAKFRPGLHEGQPVPVVVNVQVTFRIYSDRTRPQPGDKKPLVQPASTPAGHSNGKEVAALAH